MSAHPNVERVMQGYAAFAARNFESAQEIFAPDAVWQSSGRNWLVGEYRGLPAILGFLGAIDAYSEGTYTTDVHDVLANDARAVVLQTSSAHRSDGKSMSIDAAVVFEFTDGKVALVRAWPFDLYAEDEFYGLEPPAGMERPAAQAAVTTAGPVLQARAR